MADAFRRKTKTECIALVFSDTTLKVQQDRDVRVLCFSKIYRILKFRLKAPQNNKSTANAYGAFKCVKFNSDSKKYGPNNPG